uniref:Uncharacterized protein n=1 Tax=Ditylenchus dipsaci TaxID=166011 RepID=A0A915ESB3_9BILA
MKKQFHAVNQELCKAPEFALFGDDIPVIVRLMKYKVGKKPKSLSDARDSNIGREIINCEELVQKMRTEKFCGGITETDQDIVYIVNFGFSFEYYPSKSFKSLMAKHSCLSRTFQTRAFHTGFGVQSPL